ncbi:MAG: hypothetical protein JWN78_2523 [Bacteroidota bacterium]|nr:hypothetical protein [Bacteroidota bacterium]
MSEQNELFRLISSLSAAEKAYFKRFAYTYRGKENKDYMKLFDVIASQKKYNEAVLKTKLKGSKIVNNFSASKRHLTDIILNTFTNSIYTTSTEEKILVDISQIHFLNAHKNFALSKKKIHQLKKMFYENELYNFYPVIYPYELEIYTYQKEDIGERNKINEDYEFALQCMNNIRQYEQLKETWVGYSQRSQAYIRNEKQSAEYRKELEKESLRDKENALCSKSKALFFYIRTGYFLLLNEHDKAYAEAEQQFEFYQEQETYRKNNQKEYITFLANFLSRMQNVDRYEKFEQVKTLLLDEFSRCDDEDLINAKKLNLLYAEKNISFKKDNYKQAISLVPEMLNALPYFRKRKDIELTILYDIALIYFYNHEFLQALDYINRVINDEELYARKDLESYAYLIRIFIILELNKPDKFDNLLENTKKKLSREGKLFGMENVIFRLLNELLVMSSQKEKIKIITKYQPQIEKILENPLEKNALNYFNIQWWMNAKLNL